MKRNLLVLAASLMVASTAAFADQIDFHVVGAGGTWSWHGGANTLSATFDEVDLDVVGSPSPSIDVNGTETLTFTTGVGIGGTGTSGGTLTVTGCVTAPPCTDTTLFTGTFTDEPTTTKTGAGLGFNGNFIAGTLDPSAYTALGIPFGTGPVTGAIDAALTSKLNSDRLRLTGSGDMILNTPTPEPGSLALVGSGLLAVGGFLRRKLRDI